MATTLSILRSRLKAVGRAASKELGRYAIDGIHVREDVIVATDGRIMLEAPVELDGNKADHKRRILSAESAKMLLADKWTKKRGSVSLQSNGTFEAFGTDVSPNPLPLLHRDADFPNTDGVRVPPEKVFFKVALSAQMLAIIAAASLDVCEDSPSIVTFGLQEGKDGKPDASAGIRLDFGSATSSVSGVVMPCSIGGDR